MSFIEINLIKNMHKYFIFHISNKNPKKIINDVNLFSKKIFIIIIYKLYILIFKLISNNLFISNYTIFRYFFY